MRTRILLAAIALIEAGCAKKQALAPPAPPPAPAQNIFVLLPNADGKPSRIVVSNAAGSQELAEPYLATRIARADAAPSAPAALDQDTVKRLFGEIESGMPLPELVFILHFDENKDELTAESRSQLPEIFQAIRERRSTLITVTGHTDTTGTAQFNDRLAMSRAQNVAALLRNQGLDSSSLFVTSHGATDLLVKTGPGVDEPRNRRVEVIVR